MDHHFKGYGSVGTCVEQRNGICDRSRGQNGLLLAGVNVVVFVSVLYAIKPTNRRLNCWL